MVRPRAAAALRLAVIPAIVAIAILAAWKSGYFELDRRHQLLATVQRLRVLPGIEIGFVAAFAILLALCLPANVATILGGAVFGALIGAPLAWAGSLIATVFAYWLARSVARRPITRLFGEHRLLRQLKDNDGVIPLLRLRVIPVAPFAVMAYVAGIAGVSMRRLLLATAIGILPSAIAYALVGSAILKGLVSPDDASGRALWIAGGITLLMFSLSVAPAIVRRMRGSP